MELFGSLSSTTQFVVVFVLILAVLAPLAWRWFSGGSPVLGPRGRRLAVIETAPVDVRHRIVLVKRDNVEHLLLIGGPTSLVIESGINRGTAREPRPIPDARGEASRGSDADWAAMPEPVSRPLPVVDLDAAVPEPPARTAREAMVDSMRAVRSARRTPPADHGEDGAAPALAPDIRAERPADARRAPEPRPQAEAAPPTNDAAQKRAAPPPRIAAPPAPARQVQPPPAIAAPSQSDEGNFAEMAQRLEAALRRPPTKADAAPPARGSARQEPPPAGRRPPQGDASRRGKAGDTPPPDLKILSGKGQNELAMENLEDEMAKMLGRPAKS